MGVLVHGSGNISITLGGMGVLRILIMFMIIRLIWLPFCLNSTMELEREREREGGGGIITVTVLNQLVTPRRNV